ncbi:MAG TPA: peptidase domain-containing ABC transporter [Kofleriaceae bacterium]|nr:peptidase domain-containing ABC transporter [Kofleriaceae bacterium]
MDVILQSESSECGLACLAMVASHHGQGIGLRELRGRYPMSLKGTTLSRLIAIAGHLGYQSRALRLELEELPELRAPCILHWDQNHFVVLVKAGRNKIVIIDPSTGKRRLSYAEVSAHFTGIALELVPGAGFAQRERPPPISMRQLTGRMTGVWRALSMILALSVALQVFMVLMPMLMQWIVDQALVSADRDLLTVLGLGFCLGLVLQVGIGLLRGWTVVYLSTRVGLQWLGNVFSHMLELPLDFFQKRHLGDVTSRMGSVQSIQKTLTTSFIEALMDGLMAVVTLAMMLIYSAKLAAITLGAVLLYLGLRAVAFSPLREGTERQLVAGANQQSHLLESIRGIQSIKVAGREAMRQSVYFNLMNETVNREIWLAKMNLGFGTVSQMIFGIERVAVIWVGAVLAMQNVFSVGMLIAYLAYKDQFAGRVGGLIDKWIELRMLRLHGERLSDIVLSEPEVVAGDGFEQPPPASTRLVVQGLTFSYAEGEPAVLRNCSLVVEEGESVAIVGPSGCGKTTLLKILLGLLPPGEGSVSVGGKDIAKLGPHNYRQMVGAVMQDDQLFAGSIAENIAFGEDAFDVERIEAAARMAAIHEEISAMPMGYHSLIGDMGTTLSGGQKQRVILARALYRRPRILFLDEATSHLDIERERLVSDAIHGLELTKVIVAHRPETIASADRALIMADGRIALERDPAEYLRELRAAGAGPRPAYETTLVFPAVSS